MKKKTNGKAIAFSIIILFINTCFIPTISCDYSQYCNNIPSSPDRKIKHIIGLNDEGPHNKENFENQEWWYFNGVIKDKDSELHNWTFMISFNKQRTCDIFFFSLYDDNDSHYGGNIVWWPGSIVAIEDVGVDVTFNNSSYVKGKNPHWNIHVEDNEINEKNITVDLNFSANSVPHWFIINGGRNNTNSFFGHYSFLNCSFKGNISIDGEAKTVFGYGYHEHHWTTFFIKNDNKNSSKKSIDNMINTWDWYSIVLDNGWNFFLVSTLENSKFSCISPDVLWIKTEGDNFLKSTFFNVEYIETTSTPIHNVTIPTKVNVKGFFLNTLLKHPLKGIVYIDATIESSNFCENLWFNPPKSGVFEGTCKINGTFRWKNNNVCLSGRGITEINRN